MATLSSPGIGSNLDVNSIVTQLMAVERQPLTTIARKEASYQAKLSGFGTLKGALSQFQTSVRSLSDVSSFQKVNASIGDSTVAFASATGAALPGTYSLEVSKLAQGQKLVAAGQASTATAIGASVSSTISFDFGTIAGGVFNSTQGTYTGAGFTTNGTGVKTVTIDGSNNSLSGIRDAINNAQIDISATIINDGGSSPYRLSLTVNATGQSNSVKISVAGDTAVSSLMSHDPANNSGQGFAEKLTAQNALFSIDGIAVSKPSNAVNDVIQGISLNLSKTNINSPTNITVARDTTAVVNTVNAFVKAYNDINQNLKDAGAYNADTKSAAILNGESTVRNIQSQLRGILTAPVQGGASAFTLLSQVGVTVQKDGSLKVDNTKLQSAISNNFNDIAGVFASVGKSSDSLIGYSSASAKTVAGAYAVNISQLATKGSVTASSAATGLASGSITGTGVAGLNIIAGVNDVLQVQLNGVSASITLGQANYADAAALATEIQSKINAAAGFVAAGASATVTESGGIIKIASNASGASSSADVTGGNAQAGLNLGVGSVVTPGTSTVITGSNNTLQVVVDGVSSTITLSSGSYTGTTLAAEIQSKINGAAGYVATGATVAVTETGGVLKITSNRYGSASNVSITGGSGQTDLFGAGTEQIGADTAGTINGIAAIGNGQFLTGAVGDDSEGLKLQINGGGLGARGTVNYSQGYASQFDKLMGLMLDTGGPISSRTDGINASIKVLAQNKQRLAARFNATEKRYRAQFTALDVLMSSMTTTSSFLTQQLAAVAKSNA
ncbi:MAG: flagellar filament capping protein FliD [Pseudomonadota bacterium]